MVLIGVEATWVKLFFDKADVAAAFYAGEPNLRQVFDIAVETHVLLEIMNRNMIAPQHFEITFTIAHDYVRPAFDQDSEGVGIVREAGEQSVQQYRNHASAECGEKSRRAVDGARQHGGKNDQQNGGERSRARK